jgi:hypothetical protein
MIFNFNCSTLTTPISSTWSTGPLLLNVNSRKWRRMAKGKCHSLDSTLEAMLGLTSHSLTSFQATTDEPNADTDANAAPPISDATATVPDAETKCSTAANTTADELTRCATAATTEPTTSISPHNATYIECTKPRRSWFGPLFQVWHEWSYHPIVSQQAVRSWSRRPVMTSRAVELHLRQDQPRDY